MMPATNFRNDDVGAEIVEWRHVPDHSAYEVSNRGQVRRRETKGRWPAGHILSPGQAHSGHLYVIIANDGGQTRKQFVHRLVAAAFIGPAPFEGAMVLHHDDNPVHNRPENLYWGDHGQNARDAQLNRKRNSEVSQRGAQPGEENPSAVLSMSDVASIKRYIELGLCGSCIAKMYGVRKDTIYSIAKGRTWAHVREEASEDVNVFLDLNDVVPLISVIDMAAELECRDNGLGYWLASAEEVAHG